MTHWSEDPDEKFVLNVLSVAFIIGVVGLVLILAAALVDWIGGI